MAKFARARGLLREFKGDLYLHGLGVLPQVGGVTAQLGDRAVLVRDRFPGSDEHVDIITGALAGSGIELLSEIDGPAPNAPREDLARIADQLVDRKPNVIISFGGGSTIDVTKSADVLAIVGGDIEDYFGTGLVTESLVSSGETLIPHVAIQTAASSGAHLTKYSNITDVETAQKKLVVDDAIVPDRSIFDYTVTYGAPPSLTADGALDGISHNLEVLYGAVGKRNYEKIEEVAEVGIGLIVENLPLALENLQDGEAREALGLATDLGGYAIMLGGTNGGHLTSFSLVDILPHGRACAIMNPYYTVFFAPAIERPLKVVGQIYKAAGYVDANLDTLEERELGLAIARAMIEFQRDIGFPTSLGEVDGFSDKYIEKALEAAKNPQLKMKLENMPVPLSPDMIDEYMGAILRAARDGDPGMVKSV